MKIHPDVTIDAVLEAVEDSMFGLGNGGFCVACGAVADGVEPDARRYTCDDCGKPSVYGAEELLIHLA